MNHLSAFRLFSIVAALTFVAHAASTAEFPNAAQPQLAATADGRAWLVYGRGQEVFVARSDDGGSTFADPVLVANMPKLMLGMRRGPRIAAHGNQVTVTLVAHELLAFHSADGGRSWRAAELGREVDRYAFRGWTLPFTPDRAGKLTLIAKATNRLGQSQPMEPLWTPSGYMRNCVEPVEVDVL